MKTSSRRLAFAFLCVVVASFCRPARIEAGEAPSAPADAVTTRDPDIPVEQLRLLLRPLTVEELEVEARAWMLLLRAKVKEISDGEIAVRRKNLQIERRERLARAAADAQTAVETAQKVLQEAQAKGVPEAVKAAEEAFRQAEVKAREAKKVSDEAQEADRKAEEDTDVKKAAEDAVKRAEERAVKQAEETGAVLETAPDAAAPAGQPAVVDESASQDAGKLKEAAEAAKAEAVLQAEVKDKLLDNLNELRDQRTALIDRLKAVLDALKAKGGEIESYEKYINAVSGIQLDIAQVSDVSATWSLLTGWLASEQGGKRWAWNIGKFLAILIIAIIAAAILGKLVDKGLKRSTRVSGLLSEFVNKAVRRTVIFVGLIVGLSALEINVGPVMAVIGAVGFVVAFALQGTLSNFASGILILMYRPFDVGDVIEAAGIAGKVESMTLVSTRIKTFDNKAMIVPNNAIWGGVITNATGTAMRRVDMVFGIGYSDDIAKAQAILEDIVAGHKLVLADPEPVIKLNELGESSVNFICRPWAKTADYWAVYWDITRAVKEQFDRAGVSIPFPQRDIHVYHETSAPAAPAGM